MLVTLYSFCSYGEYTYLSDSRLGGSKACLLYMHGHGRDWWSELLLVVDNVGEKGVFIYLHNGLDSLLNRAFRCRRDPRQHWDRVGSVI